MSHTSNINGFFPTLAVAADSSAGMIWPAAHGSAYVRVRSPSGQLGPLRRLANLGNAIPTAIAVAPGGRVTVLMSAFTHHEGENLVYLQQLEPSGRLDRPRRIAYTDSRSFAESGVIAIDPAGNAIVTWTTGQYNDTVCCARVWTRTLFTTGKLGPAVAVSPPSDDADNGFTGATPGVAVASNGVLTFVWTSMQLPLANLPVAHVEARTMTPRGAMGPVRTISPGYHMDTISPTSRSGRGIDLVEPKVVAFASGTAIVNWTIQGNRSAAFYERSVSRTRAGPIRPIVTGGYAAQSAQLLAGAHTALEIWPSARNQANQFETGIQTRTVSPVGQLGPVQTALPPQRAPDTLSASVAAAMNTNGRAVAVTVDRSGLVILARQGP
jgi:hypothetical protein